MEARIDFGKVPQGARDTMFAFEKYLRQSGLEPALLDLVKVRASQINGCAYCIDMHTQEARARGETEQRLYTLSVWRETPFFSDRERAALEWTEAVTLVSHSHVSDGVYQAVRKHFGEKELIDLTMAIITINSWNRLAISFRTVPGTYHPPVEHKAAASAAGSPPPKK